MTKAILVMDMPESCDVCPFEKEDHFIRYCEFPGCGKRTEDYICCRAEWCPLKPMPEKHTFFTGISREWKEGWNACVDAICGKE